MCHLTGEPTLYNEAFDKLVNWVLGSLDLYRCELAGILYPLFMYVFLKLHEKVGDLVDLTCGQLDWTSDVLQSRD